MDVSCKVYDPYIGTANPDGYWYRIASAPWNDQYYAIANTFMNGDSWGGPYTHNTDFNVPDCGAAPTPTPAPSVTLSQGPAAPAGYRYAVTLNNFAANSSLSINCYDSVSPGGFYTFTLTTDGSGSASTASQCFSGDGPDHWVVAGGVESNHVSWGAGAVPPPVTSPPASSPVVTLAQGPQAPSGYRYAITLDGFTANSSVAVTCYDSVSPGGFYVPFSLTTDGSGHASTASQCFSGDGPDHWVVAGGIESNHVSWGAAPAPGPAPVPVPVPVPVPGSNHVIINGVDVGVAQNQPHAWGPCTVQDFRDGPHGWVIVSYTNGTHIVRNGMLWGWLDNGGAPSFGCPMNDEYDAGGRVRQDFTRGSLYWMPGMDHARPVTPKGSYVALGDSYSSGEGVPPFTQMSQADGCHRSGQAYSRQWVELTHWSGNVTFMACSGAKIGDFYNGKNGERRQLDYLNSSTTLVSLTAGGNDVDFPQVMTVCVFALNCELAADAPATEFLVRYTIPRLARLYSDVLAKAPNAQVYVLGYPRFFSPSPSLFCNGIDYGEARWINSMENSLNAGIQRDIQGIGNTRLHYVDTSDAFAGGELCAGSVPIYMNGLISAHHEYSFHPTAGGQAMMALRLQRSVAG